MSDHPNPNSPFGDYGEHEPGLNAGQPLPGYPGTPGGYDYSLGTGAVLVQGDGSARVRKSIGRSFGLFGESAGSWLGFVFLSGLLLLIAIGAVFAWMIVTYVVPELKNLQPGQQPPPVPAGVQIVFGVVTALIVAPFSVWCYNAGLQAAEGRSLTMKKFFALKHGFFNAYVVIIILSLLSTLGQLVGMFFPSDSSTIMNVGEIDITSSSNGLGTLVSAGLGLVVFFFSPLVVLAPMYCLDRGLGVGAAFAQCINDSQSNYFKILAFTAIMGILMAVSVIPLGLGLLVTVPMYVIGAALIYRQISGGQHVDLDG